MRYPTVPAGSGPDVLGADVTYREADAPADVGDDDREDPPCP
jgi:hypothetical protein